MPESSTPLVQAADEQIVPMPSDGAAQKPSTDVEVEPVVKIEEPVVSDKHIKSKVKVKQDKQKPKDTRKHDHSSKSIPSNSTIKTVDISLSIEERPSAAEKDVELPLLVSSSARIEEKIELPQPQKVTEMELVKQDVVMQFPSTETVIIVKEEPIVREKTPSHDTSSSSSSRRKKKGHKKDPRERKPEGLIEATLQVSETPALVVRPDDTSVETSLAESTEIIITGGESSSDTTKPTDQEIVIFEESLSLESPRLDIADDPGYDAEDKTTLDEISVTEDNEKNKKKKKRKQKTKVKDTEPEVTWNLSDHSSLEQDDKSDTPHTLAERKARKRKHDRKDDGPLYNIGEPHEQSFPDEVSKDIVMDMGVKIIEEGVQSLPSSESMGKVESRPDSVHVVEPLQTLEESVQTSPLQKEEAPKQETIETYTQISTVEFLGARHEGIQTVTPEVVETVRVETSMQTSPSERLMTETSETSIQTQPEVAEQEKVETSMQTQPEAKASLQEVEVQTPQTQTVHISMQTLEEKRPTQEESMQTSPEPKVHTSQIYIQTLTSEIVPSSDVTAQTITPEAESVDVEMQTSPENKLTTREESMQTNFPQISTLEISTQVNVPVTEESSQTVTLLEEPKSDTFDSSVQTPGYEFIDISSQTSTPEPKRIEISQTYVQTSSVDPIPSQDAFMQTSPSILEIIPEMPSKKVHPSREGSSQTFKIETVDIPIQTRTGSLTTTHDVQTSPLPETTTSHVSLPTNQTQDSSNQTAPVPMMELGSEKQTSSSDEPYEVHVQASISFSPGESGPWSTTVNTRKGGLDAFLDAERSMGQPETSSDEQPQHTDSRSKQQPETSTDENKTDKLLPKDTKKSKRKNKPKEDKDSKMSVVHSKSPQKDDVLKQISTSTGNIVSFPEPHESNVPPVSKSTKPTKKQPGKEQEILGRELDDQSKLSYSDITSNSSVEQGPVPAQPVRLGEHSPGPPGPRKSSSLVGDNQQTLEIIQVSVETDPAIKWKSASNLVTERVKNLQNARKTTHLSGVLYLATLQQVVSQESLEERNDQLEQNLKLLRSAVQKKDAFVIQRTVITTIETISTWLETIEYRVHLNGQHTDASSTQDVINEFGNLKEEINHVEEGVEALGGVLDEVGGICNDDDKARMKECVMSLREQVRVVEEVTHDNREQAVKDLSRWEEFLNGVNNVGVLVDELKGELDEVLDSDASAAYKLERLDQIEASNRCHMLKTGMLLSTASGLLRDFPGQEIPAETYVAHETTNSMEHSIGLERERLLQLLSLADEYEQTLQEFSQIVDVAEAMVESTISVSGLQHLQEEMQKHRKFFVNLSHCRGILESLEGNLDTETRNQHADLHQLLHQRATMILDKAAGRAQQMALAASRWTVLEQGMREEQQWLQVAHQRVPDLTTVTSSDYDQYISLYQSLSTDVAIHHARIVQLLGLAHRLHELVTCVGIEASYDDHLDVIRKLQEAVDSNLCRLLAFRDTWLVYDLMNDKLEFWMKGAEKELDKMLADTTPPAGNMRQFWELKAQYEVHNNIRNEAAVNLESSMRTIPVADEMLQRQFFGQLEERWREITARITARQAQLTESRLSQDVPIHNKLVLLEQELTELQDALNDMHGIIKNDDELNLYIERVQVMHGRVMKIQEELGCLGLLSSTESEKVGALLAMARRVELQLTEELEGSTLLRTKLQDIQRGIARVKRNHQRAEGVLDQCEASEKLSSDVVEQAVNNCQGVGDELVTEWQVLMSLRQLLHTLPMRLRVSVSPVKVEREISLLQDTHTNLESRCSHLLALLRGRLTLWRRFERQLEMVQQSVQEADYMMELLTVQGAVDYDRLLKATERLEGLYGSLDQRDELLEDLRSAAEPLTASCSPEVSAKIEAAVEEAVTAWTDTCQTLLQLYTRYQDAVKLWRQYRDASEQVKAWADQQLDSVSQLVPEEALKQVKVCEETLAAHQARLMDLRQLVTQIAADVGLDAGGPLGDEVTALGHRLEQVRETLTSLAAAADARAAGEENLLQTKAFLSTVQQSLSVVEDSNEKDVENQLTALRGHLLALGRTEGQIQNIKKSNFKLGPMKSETSIVEILQLWQQVFRDTFQQYHRLSARLVKSQDGAAVLRLWQEYLLHVQSFLSASIPDDYISLTEHQHLCEVHQNLLTSQQSVLLSKDESQLSDMELSVAEQFNSLTNLHNETLARIMERHGQVRERLVAWDKYRTDQSHLLSWLRDTERERGRLQLRYIHLRRVPKMLQRIESLLEDMPTGISQLAQLEEQQQHLVQCCDPALSTSIRMEHAATSTRVSNLHAGLETWREFLLRIGLMAGSYEEKVTAIQDALQKTRTAATQALPSSQQDLEERLTTLRGLRTGLVNVGRDLEELGVTQEQLKESLSPQDLRTINQRVWLLWQQQADLDHELSVLCHQLEERLGMSSLFLARQSRFVSWAGGVETRLESSTSRDSEEVNRRYEADLKNEVALKRREYEWLIRVGKELVEATPEGEEKTQLSASVKEVTEAWETLQELGQARANKLNTILQTVALLEPRLHDLLTWVGEVEVKLATPVTLDARTKKAVDKQLTEHDQLQRSIEQQSGNVADVLNLSEMILGNGEAFKTRMNMDAIATASATLDRRWRTVCVMSAERKRVLRLLWKTLQGLLKAFSDNKEWVSAQDSLLTEMDSVEDQLSQGDINALIARTEAMQGEIVSRNPALEILDCSYSRLVKDHCNLQPLVSDVRSTLHTWHSLAPRAKTLLHKLHRLLKGYREFVDAHGKAVVSLTQIDVRLTQVQHLEATPPARQRQQIAELEQELEAQSSLLRTADGLALSVMRSSKKEEQDALQEMIDEYQNLYKEISSRLYRLRKEADRQATAVDESIQVETLRFEQDSAVQVDTLPPVVTPRDAFIYELDTAIRECRANLDSYQTVISQRQKPQPKLVGSCESSIELIEHLSGLLMRECGATPEEARVEDVATLVECFRQLLLQVSESQQAQQQCDSARLTCPLCSSRNWQQLDNDLWRLEQWLQFAEGTQSDQRVPPSNIEQLEDAIQDHREFLLDLNSHKDIVVSLNIVGTHLADHTEDEARSRSLRDRLDSDNTRWDLVCAAATVWQSGLQLALMQNAQFHQTIGEMMDWLEKTELRIRQSEPVDITEDISVIEAKYNKFLELRNDLERCEPRVMSLQEAADQLLKHSEAPEGAQTTLARLTDLRLRLQSLRRLTAIYVLKLGAVLGRDSSTVPLASLSQDLLDSTSIGQFGGAPRSNQPHETGDDEVDTSVLTRGYRFLGRVVRASLPIQALMLLMLGVAALVPSTEEDYSCTLSNTFARSFEPMLRYPNGPPPT